MVGGRVEGDTTATGETGGGGNFLVLNDQYSVGSA